MKKFKGTIAPFFEISALALKVNFNEVVSLSDWQEKHPQFQFALNQGWVVGVDKKSLVFNSGDRTIEARKNLDKLSNGVSERQAVSNMQVMGIGPKVLEKVLENQTVLIQGFQKSYESFKQSMDQLKPEAVSSLTNELLAQVLSQNKVLLEQLSKKLDGDNFSSEILSTLREIKTHLVNQKVQVVYNTAGDKASVFKEAEFKIQDFEEKFIPKVEDLNVKNSKIVTQQTSSGSVEDAAAALRKLKKGI